MGLVVGHVVAGSAVVLVDCWDTLLVDSWGAWLGLGALHQLGRFDQFSPEKNTLVSCPFLPQVSHVVRARLGPCLALFLRSLFSLRHWCLKWPEFPQ